MKTDPKLGEHFADRGPGAHLRQAREAANMSVADVADALFLHPNKIEALESDTFDRLAAPTFVRGYLRGYARVLGLPSGPILDMYDRQGFGPPPLAPEVLETKQAHISDPPVRLVTYTVGAVLVLLVGLWWRSQGDTGFDIGDDLFGWWPDVTAELSLPDAGAPAPTPTGDEEGGDSFATAPDRIGKPSRGGGPSASSPPEAPATAGIPPDAPVPDDDNAGSRGAVAMAPGQTDGPPQGGGPPASSPPETPANAGIPPDALVPDDDNAGSRAVAMAPGRTDGPPQGGEPPASSPAEAPAIAGIAGTGPAPAERAGPEAMTGPEASATPEARPEVAAGAEPAAGADSGDAGRPEASAPHETRHADATDGPGGAAAPETETPPSIPGTVPSETASAPLDLDVGATAVAGTAQSGLVLAFVHESWVEVFDRERTRLFFDLVQPGRVLNFEGTRPFDVLLGNSEDVRVAIDGAAFDHTPYVRHGVARFSVGAAPAGSTDPVEPSDTVAADVADSREASSQPRDGNSR